jgi:hypothetical protein
MKRNSGGRMEANHQEPSLVLSSAASGRFLVGRSQAFGLSSPAHDALTGLATHQRSLQALPSRMMIAFCLGPCPYQVP